MKIEHEIATMSDDEAYRKLDSIAARLFIGKDDWWLCHWWPQGRESFFILWKTGKARF